MSFIFTMRSTPTSSLHRRDASPGSPLPAISEDGTASFAESRHPPPIPVRASNRPAHKHFGLGVPPRHSYDSPPSYSHFSLDDEGERPNAEKLAAARQGVLNNRHIAKRGGWKRLLVIAIVIALCIVGLVVGLVIGLRNRHKNSSNNSGISGGASGNISGGPNNPTTSTIFPAGSYSFTTYLSTISTNCSSNPATWTCYPYTTYASSPSASTATFQWIIDPIPNSSNYTISSTDNLFTIVFTNLTLFLQNAGQQDEYYYFQTEMQKPTRPSVPLTDQNLAATCYFNQTSFAGYLYTKMAKTFPAGANSTGTGQPFEQWPYAVRVEQISGGGAGTPTCLGPQGQSLGSFSAVDTSQICECLYLNDGT